MKLATVEHVVVPSIDDRPAVSAGDEVPSLVEVHLRTAWKTPDRIEVKWTAHRAVSAALVVPEGDFGVVAVRDDLVSCVYERAD